MAALETRRRDLLFVAGGLGAISLSAWAYQFWMAQAMTMAAGPSWQWTPAAVFMTFLMWAVMMLAMMLPTALPFVAAYSTLSRARAPTMSPSGGTVAFVGGYVLAWSMFSIGATMLQVLLDQSGMLSPSMGIASTWLGGAVLLLAGIYQFTPMKAACARHCRTPIGFFMARWRDGPLGALSMGARHGAYCVGCCWLLMVTMFVVGVMSLAWMLILTAVMLTEKLPAIGERVGRVAGWALLTAGGYFLVVTYLPHIG